MWLIFRAGLPGALDDDLVHLAAIEPESVPLRADIDDHFRLTGIGFAHLTAADGAFPLLLARPDLGQRQQLGQGQIARLASQRLQQQLELAGVKPGDKVRCGNLEWEW